VCQLLPATPRGHPFVLRSLRVLVLVYGVACVRARIPWERMTLAHHSAAVIGFQPLIGLGIWVSGGVDSYLGPILALSASYAAYFFPPRSGVRSGWSRSRPSLAGAVHAGRRAAPARRAHRCVRRTYAGLTFTIRLMTRRLAPPKRTSAAWRPRTR
jgi:hypothetical protein